MSRNTMIAVSGLFLSACANQLGGPNQFGAATDANLALHSIRPIAPNAHTTIEGGTAGRAGQPVERLRQGERIQPSTTGVGG